LYCGDKKEAVFNVFKKTTLAFFNENRFKEGMANTASKK